MINPEFTESSLSAGEMGTKRETGRWLPRRQETSSSRWLQHISTETTLRSLGQFNKILNLSTIQVNPGLLVVVEGVEYAGNLEGARHHPIVLSRHIYHLKSW